MPERLHVRDQGQETLRTISYAVFPDAIRSTEAMNAYRFVDDSFSLAEVAATDIIGATLLDNELYAKIVARTGPGVVLVEADQLIVSGNQVKSAPSGKATRLVAADLIQNSITGDANSFTQPGAADEVAIHQASDIAGDRGRGIVIIGTDANVDPISETILLDASDTTQVSSGTTQFTNIIGAFTEDGEVVGADITIEEAGDGTDIATLADNTASLGVVPLGDSGYSAAVNFVAGNAETTYVVLKGKTAADPENFTLETYAWDNAVSVTSGTRWKELTEVYVGAFTDDETADLYFIADAVGTFLGVALGDAPAGGLVPVAFQPNFFSVASGSVVPSSLPATSLVHIGVLDGQDGDPATYDTANSASLAGVAVGDIVLFVGVNDGANIWVDVTENFTVTNTNELTDGGADDYTNSQLFVAWEDRT